MMHPYAANINMETRHFIESKLLADPKLAERGVILAGPSGNLLGIERQLKNADLDRVSGCLEYKIRDGSLDITFLKNRPEETNNCGEFLKYDSAKAREKGRMMLFGTFMVLPEFIQVGSLWIDTWVIPARPHLLYDKNSCYYLWQPKDPDEHAKAVRHFMKKPVLKLDEHKWKKKELAEYHYLLR